MLAIAQQGDGRLVVGGYFWLYNGASAARLVRLMPDGTRDASFDVGTGFDGIVYSVLAQRDGKVVVGGLFTGYKGTARGHIARLLANGALDVGFNPGSGFNDNVAELLELADGAVLAAGSFTSFGGVGTNRLARLTNSGALDASFTIGSGASSSLGALGFSASGAYVAAGSLTTFNGALNAGIVQVRADGSVDSGFSSGAGFSGGVEALLVQPDGMIIAGGFFDRYNGTPRTGLARLRSNGELDASFSVDGILKGGNRTAFVALGIDALAWTNDSALLAGGYWISFGAIETGGLVLLEPVPPVVSVQPLPPEAVRAGESVSLHVDAIGPSGASVELQWQVLVPGAGPSGVNRGLVAGSWVDVVGATSPTLTLPSVQRFLASDYRVVVTANGVSVASDVVTISVTAPPPNDARLLNLSTRGLAGAGANQLFPGFVVQGAGTKRLLIRAVGPTLAAAPINFPFPVAPDPHMELKRYNFATSAYEDVTANDDWQTNPNAADIIRASAALGAFALSDPKDATLLVDLSAGQYAVVAGDKNGTAGIAIVELYDADTGNPSTRLINISNRGFAGVGAEVMIPGFVVSDEGPKTLLVRVVGPTLGSFNVPGTMADPKLTIYKHNFTTNADDLLLTNDNWSDNPDAAYTAQIAAQVLAFPLNQGSADAAFVVTLTPGVYTVIGSSADGTGTGVVLVEVYVVP